ncbi:hypothetical protein GCM10010275_51040 [Streptomyces litmocidini]|uniref:hypothetical protein n=1 Tax=Streptomyces litmocidini TaxID=67318 RepID=UPI00167EC8B7|nr:hypothetical protein [Streptomyces litmocidini]GGV05304.1 hypothetical protein GCM10010275_51040 [Streptomyces litmocidini]
MDFRARARRTQGWGLGLLTVAALLWIRLAVLLFTPYETGDSGHDCTSRFTSENLHDDESSCVVERDRPELLAVLGASVPVSVIGGVLCTSGSVSHRTAEHLAEVTRLDAAST